MKVSRFLISYEFCFLMEGDRQYQMIHLKASNKYRTENGTG